MGQPFVCFEPLPKGRFQREPSLGHEGPRALEDPPLTLVPYDDLHGLLLGQQREQQTRDARERGQCPRLAHRPLQHPGRHVRPTRPQKPGPRTAKILGAIATRPTRLHIPNARLIPAVPRRPTIRQRTHAHIRRMLTFRIHSRPDCHGPKSGTSVEPTRCSWKEIDGPASSPAIRATADALANEDHARTSAPTTSSHPRLPRWQKRFPFLQPRLPRRSHTTVPLMLAKEVANHGRMSRSRPVG